jgi:hypothetical protein
VCGPRWILNYLERFHHHFVRHGGQLYYGRVVDYDWKATAAAMRRQAKKLGIPLRYVCVRDEDETTLTVISSIPVGDVAHPVELAEALSITQQALDNAATGRRPVQSCKAWGKLPRESDVERLKHKECSPAAFKATVWAWEADVEASGRLLLCNRPGLFLDSAGVVDVQAREDFWFETWLRDRRSNGDGYEDPEEYHQRAAEQRERITKPPPPPPAVECDHTGLIDETPTFDGYVNRTCRRCGQNLPCRKADRAP